MVQDERDMVICNRSAGVPQIKVANKHVRQEPNGELLSEQGKKSPEYEQTDLRCEAETADVCKDTEGFGKDDYDDVVRDKFGSDEEQMDSSK